MVQEWEKLCDVKHHHTSFKFLHPPSSNEVGDKHPSILSGPLGDASKLVRLESAIVNSFKLQALRKHLFKQLAQHVKQDIGAE